MKRIRLFSDHTHHTPNGPVTYKAGEFIELSDEDAAWLVTAILNERSSMREQASKTPGTVEFKRQQ